MISIARGPIRWMLRWRGFSGVTLPPFGIFIIEEHMQDDRLIRHEKEHWRQAQEMGTLKFYAVYLWLLARHGYDKHPMEIEARAAEG